MDRNGLWVGLIVQVFILGMSVKYFLQGMEEDEMWQMILSVAVGMIMIALIVVSVRKLRELY